MRETADQRQTARPHEEGKVYAQSRTIWRFAGLMVGGLMALGVGVIVGVHSGTAEAPQKGAFLTAAPILSTQHTVMEEPLVYPAGEAKMTAVVAILPPGAETGWHTHAVPTFGYILDGEITVDYGPKGTRTYRKGEALMEATGTPHNGRNTGTTAARLLAVFIGADDRPLTVPTEKPE